MGRRPATFWDVVCSGAQTEHITASLAKGARVIAIGTFRTRTWTAADGAERATLEILADEIGPSLRWATTQVTKSQHLTGPRARPARIPGRPGRPDRLPA